MLILLGILASPLIALTAPIWAPILLITQFGGALAVTP